MVKVTEMQVVSDYKGEPRKVIASLFADTKEEISEEMTVIGLPENATMEPSSSVLTADGEVALMKSDGTWNWLGEE